MKLIRKALSLIIALGMLACGSAMTGPQTCTSTVQGFAGDVTVWVTVDGDDIIAVVAEGLEETPGKGAVAIEELPAAFAENDTVDVEGITGATITSDALKLAVEQALSGKVVGEAPVRAEVR